MDVRMAATEMGTGFEEQLNRVMRNGDRIIVQHAGADAAIVMSLAELEEWEAENSYTNKAPAVGPQIPFF